jgi:hypothetical protein
MFFVIFLLSICLQGKYYFTLPQVILIGVLNSYKRAACFLQAAYFFNTQYQMLLNLYQMILNQL